MKRRIKNIISSILAIAILGTTFAITNAESNVTSNLGDDYIDVLVEKNLSIDGETMTLNIELKGKDEKTSIQSIIFPGDDHLVSKDLKLRKEPEKISENNTYEFSKSENGKYQFLVSYQVIFDKEEKTDSSTTKEEKESSDETSEDKVVRTVEYLFEVDITEIKEKVEPILENSTEVEEEKQELTDEANMDEGLVDSDSIEEEGDSDSIEEANEEPIESVKDQNHDDKVEKQQKEAPKQSENKEEVPVESPTPISENVERAGEKITADFGGAALGNDSEYITQKSDFSGTTTKLLNINVAYPSDATNKKIKKLIIDLDYPINLYSAPGFTYKGGNFTFDKSTLPVQLQGIIIDAKFTPNPNEVPEFNGINKSGSIEYTLSPQTTNTNISILTQIRAGYMMNTEGISLRDSIKLHSYLDNQNLSNVKLEKLTQTEKLTAGISINATYGSNSYFKNDDDYIVGKPYALLKRATGITLDIAYSPTYMKFIEFDMEYSKQLELAGFIKNTANGDYTKDDIEGNGRFILTPITGPNPDMTYMRVRYNDAIIHSQNGHNITPVMKVKDKSLRDQSYILKFKESSYVKIGLFNGEVLEAPHATTGEQKFTRSEFDNKVVLDVIVDSISINEEKDTIIPIGRLGFTNPHPQDVTDSMFKVVFPEVGFDITALRLNTGTVRAYDIHGKTTKGRDFTAQEIIAGLGKSREINRDNISIVLENDEYLKEISWTEERIPSGYQSWMVNGVSQQYIGNTFATFYGKINAEIKAKTYNVQFSTVPKGDGSFESNNAQKINSQVRVLNNDKLQAMFGSVTPRVTKSGDSNKFVGVWNHGARSIIPMSRAANGIIFYFHEKPGLEFNLETLEFIDVSKVPNVVYSKENGNLVYEELIDVNGNSVYKVEFSKMKLSMANGAKQLTWSMDFKIKNTASTFTYMVSDLFYYDTYNPNSGADPERRVYGDFGVPFIGKSAQTGNKTIAVSNTSQVGFFVSTSANINDGKWVTYDGTEKTVLSLNPDGKAKYKLQVQNNSGGDVPGYKTIIPIPKAKETTSNALIQDSPFGWDMVLNKPLSNNGTTYNYTFKYSTKYTDDFDESKKTVWKDWTDIPNKAEIRSILVFTNDVIFTSERNDESNPGSDQIVFEVDFNNATSEVQAGNVNTYSSLIKRSLAGNESVVSSAPISVRLQTGIIKGKIYDDTNKNNNFDTDEKGIANVKVQAYKTGTKTLLETATSNGSGLYEFKGLSKSQNIDVVILNPTTDDSMRFSNLGITDNQAQLMISNVIPSSTQAMDLDAGFMSPFEVKFEQNNGALVTTLRKYPSEKILATEVTNPSKKGYVFTKWNKKSNGTATDDITLPITVTQDETYYARYTANKYKVTYKANGGIGNDSSQDHTYDSKVNLLPASTFTRSGYTFLGWSTNAADTAAKYLGGQQVSNLSDKAAVTLYAIWQGNVLSVDGTINVVDKNNTAITTSKYKKDFVVGLYDGSTKLGTATTDVNVKYSIKNLQITSSKAYTLKVEKPETSKLEFVDSSELSVNLTIGMNSLNNNFSITDKLDPVVSVVALTPTINPTAVSYTVKDNETEIASESWKITNSSNVIVKSGTNKNEVVMAINEMINSAETGKFKLTVTVSDIAKNEASQSVSFSILAKGGTKPIITGTKSSFDIEVVKTGEKPSVTKIISDFGITAKDGLGNVITKVDSFKVEGIEKVDVTTIKEYALKISAIDAMGQESTPINVKYVVKDTTKPILSIDNKTIVYNNTFKNPKVPTLSDLESSGVFGDIVVSDNDKGSNAFTLISDDFATIDLTTEGIKSFNVYVKDKSTNQSNIVNIKVRVELYDGIDGDLGWGIKASSFTTSLDQVQTGKGIINAAGAKVYNIKVNPATVVPSSEANIVSNKSSLIVGKNEIELSVKQSNGVLVPNLKLNVEGKVFAVIGDAYAINAENIIANYQDVSTADGIKNLAQVKVFDITDIDNPVEIINPSIKVEKNGMSITKLELGQNQKIKLIFERDGKRVEKIITADIYSAIKGNYGLIANSFITSIDKVKDSSGILKESGAQIFDITTKQPAPIITLKTDPLKLIEGNDQVVTISAPSIVGLETKISADVYSSFQDMVGINALDDFTISLSMLKNNMGNEKTLLAKGSQVKAYRYSNGIREEIGLSDIDITPIPTSTGTKDIVYKVKNTSAQTIGKKVTVLDTEIKLASLDAVVLNITESKTISEADLLSKFKVDAKLGTTILNPKFKDGDLIKVNTVKTGQEAPITMTLGASASNGDETQKSVRVYIVDECDGDSKIGMNAHSFKAKVSEITRANFIGKSELIAYDFSQVETGGNPVKVVDSNISVNQDALSNKKAVARPVTFTAKIGNREESITVIGHIYDEIDGNIAFNILPEFQVAVKNANEEVYIKESEIRAWYIEDVNNPIQISNSDIRLVTPINTALNQKHSIQFEAEYNGEKGAVSSKVTLTSTNIELNVKKNIAISLKDVGKISDDPMTLFGVTSSVQGDIVTVSFDNDALNQIKDLTKPNAGGVAVKVLSKANSSLDETYTYTTVYVYDQVNTDSQMAMNGHGFVLELKNLENSKLLDQSEIGAWNLSELPLNKPNQLVKGQITIDPTTDASNKSLGDRIVSFDATLNGTRQIVREVPVTIVHKYDASKKEGINANNFSIALNELSEGRILEKSNAERVVVNSPGNSSIDNKVRVISPKPLDYPSSGNSNIPVVLETENGVQYTITMNVKETNINLKVDSVINITLDEAKAMTESLFKTKAHISASQVGFGNPTISIDPNQLDVLNNLEFAPDSSFVVKVEAISVDPTEPRDRTTKTVEVRVFDEIGTNYAMRAKNIVAKYDDVRTKSHLMREADVKIINLNTNREAIILPTDLNFIMKVDETNRIIESLNVGTMQKIMIAPAGSYGIDAHEINANVYDDYDPNSGLSISSQDFIAKLADVDTSEKVVSKSMAMVYDAKTATARPDLLIEASNVPMQLGKQTVTMKHGVLQTTSIGDIYNEYNSVNKEMLNAHNFAIQLSNVSPEALKSAAELSGFSVMDSQITNLDGSEISVDNIPTKIGTHSVTFRTEKGTQYTVIAYVMDQYDLISKIGFNGHNFDIELDDVSVPQFEALSEVMAFDARNVVNEAPSPIGVVLKTTLPTTVGTSEVQYAAEISNGVSVFILKVNVFNKIDNQTNESLNAHNFSIQLKDISVDTVKTLSGLEGYTLVGNGKVEAINSDEISVSSLPLKVGTYPITFTTNLGTAITVQANVFDVIDSVSKIGFEGHDFDVVLEDISKESFKQLSEIKAFDISSVESIGKVEPTPKLETVLPKEVGAYPVRYSAKVGDRIAYYDLKVNVFNQIDTITKESMNAHNFAIELNEVNESTVKTLAGLQAYKLLGEGKVQEISLDDITVSSLPTDLGTYSVTFTTQAGTSLTVQMNVFDQIDSQSMIAFDGHNFDIELENVSKSEFERLSEVKAYDISDLINIGKVELVVKLETELPENVGTYRVQYSAKKDSKTGLFDLSANVFNKIDPSTHESMNAHDIALQLKDVSETRIKIDSGLEAFSLYGNGSIAPIDVNTISMTSVPNSIGTYPVIFTTPSGTSITIQVHVFDKIDDETKIAFEGHDFNIKLKDVSKENFLNLSEVKAYDVSDVVNNGKVQISVKQMSELPKEVGSYELVYSASVNGNTATIELTSYVYSDISVDGKYALQARDFIADIKDVQTQKGINNLASVKVFDLSTHNEISNGDVISRPNRLSTGINQSILFEEINFGLKTTVTGDVYDSIDKEKRKGIIANDFIALVKDVRTEKDIVKQSGAKVFNIDSKEVDKGAVINSNPKELKKGNHEVMLSSGRLEKNVQAFVYDEISHTNKETINANDFTIALDDISIESIKKYSRVEAFDISDPDNIMAITDIKITSKLPTTLGQHKVSFATEKGTKITVTAKVIGHGSVDDGKDSIYGNDFKIAITDISEERIRELSGAVAYDLAGIIPVELDSSKIKVSAFLKQPGKQEITLSLESGRSVTVTMSVTATYRVEGNNISMTENELRSAISKGTLKDEIVKRSDGKVIIVETGLPTGTLNVTYDGIMPTLNSKAGDVVKVNLEYTVANEFLTEKKRFFGMFKDESKETTVVSKSITITVTSNPKELGDDKVPSKPGADKGPSDPGSNNQNTNKPNVKDDKKSLNIYPSTGLKESSSVLISGLLLSILGLIVVLSSKRKKKEGVKSYKIDK